MKKRTKGHPLIAIAAVMYDTAFKYSLVRVYNLISVYRLLRGANKGGRRPVHATDILRAATVLLHAALEDLLRGIACSRITKNSAPDILDKIPLLGTTQGGEPKKFWLGALAPHADKKVDELINESVRAYYRHSVTFNNRGDIIRLFQCCGLKANPIISELKILDEMIQRRHSIVHHGDRDPRHRYVRGYDDRNNRGFQVAKPLSVDKVERWAKTAERFARKSLEMMSGGEYSRAIKGFQQGVAGYRRQSAPLA